MRLNSIRFKISVLYVAILGAILVLYSTILYLSLHYTLYDEFDNELDIKAQEIAGTIDAYLGVLPPTHRSFMLSLERTICFKGEDSENDDLSEIFEIDKLWLKKVDKFDFKEDYINILDSRGRSLISSSNMSKDLSAFLLKHTKPSYTERTLKNIKYERRSLRVIGIPFYYRDRHYIIQVAVSLKPLIHLLQVRLLHISISIPLVLAITSFVGQIFAKRILKPVMEITETASNITHEDLSARVKTEHVDEEMRYLVDAFNEMISRLEKSFRYIAEFSSDVSHELKTPLAIIRGESEVALRKERNPGEYKRVLRVNIEETKRMLKTIEDLLLLSKLDYREKVFKFERFNLLEFFNEVYEHAKILAAQRDISVNIDIASSEPVFINGDKLHLRRLFLNLINNAVKFNTNNGKIDISVRHRDRKAIISVSDTGIGIAKEDLPKVFDKFFHKDRIDIDVESGDGLGLSIAQSIASVHQGNIKVQSELGKGTSFTVKLPLA